MGHQLPPNSSTKSGRSIRISSSYRLLSTYVVVFWGLFIVVTLVAHELARRATWNGDYVFQHGGHRPWVYRPNSGLHSVLRIVFTQAHGPITSMHLARLVIGTLDAHWAIPRTWMEVFWLADRRWAGPFGLGKTGWTIISRRLRVSLSFFLLATLNIVALVTPVVMSRAYIVATGYAHHRIRANVSVFNVSAASDENIPHSQLYDSLQDRWGESVSASALWSKGLFLNQLLPWNVYAEVDERYFDERHYGSGWFLAGQTMESEMTLSGIRIAGGCEATLIDPTPSTFTNICKTELGPEWNPGSVVSKSIVPLIRNYIFITNSSHCSNVGPDTRFGSTSNSTVLFRMWNENAPLADDQVVLLRCNATFEPGTAFVDGLNMEFSQFARTAANYEETDLPKSSIPLDPVAAITQSDLSAFQASVYANDNADFPPDEMAYKLGLMEMAMWGGIMAMSTVPWLQASWIVEQSGVQKLETTGIYHDRAFFCTLIVLLGIWFAGMIGATAALLRPTWTSTLDGYAVARMLQYQPVVSGTPDVWFGDLEDNQDMLMQFKMH